MIALAFLRLVVRRHMHLLTQFTFSVGEGAARTVRANPVDLPVIAELRLSRETHFGLVFQLEVERSALLLLLLPVHGVLVTRRSHG